MNFVLILTVENIFPRCKQPVMNRLDSFNVSNTDTSFTFASSIWILPLALCSSEKSSIARCLLCLFSTSISVCRCVRTGADCRCIYCPCGFCLKIRTIDTKKAIALILLSFRDECDTRIIFSSPHHQLSQK